MIKIGFVGYGYWGENILRNLISLESVEVKMICDKNKDHLFKALKVHPQLKGKATTSYNSLLIDKEIEAIVLATTPETHYSLVKKALNADKHVFVEKPFSTNSEEAKELVKLAKSKKKILEVGYTFLYHPVINDIKTLIVSGEIGKVYYIDFIMTNLGKYQKYNVLWDLAPHGVSIVLHLLDSPKVERVEVNGIDAVKKGLIDVAYLTLYLKDEDGNKILANIHFSWLNPNKERRLTIVGSKKMIVFDDISPLEKIRVYNKGVDESKSFSSWGESIVGYRHGNIVIPITSTGEPLKIELQDFITSIKHVKEGAKPLSDGEMGLRVTKIIEQASEKLK